MCLFKNSFSSFQIIDCTWRCADPEKQGQLDWTRRYKIIGEIAQGILHLHQDSHPTIIYRDFKASNILLDAEMNPKISDFGMATIFGMEETRGNSKWNAETL